MLSRHHHLVCVVTLLFLLQSAHSLSSSSQHKHPSKGTSLPPFLSFDFDPSTGICRNPASFRYTSPPADNNNNSNNNSNNNNAEKNDKTNAQFFVLRNVPGDGDCVFHAVLSAVFISMGFMNPDADAGDTLLSSMALEMRSKLYLYVCTCYIRDRVSHVRTPIHYLLFTQFLSITDVVAKFLSSPEGTLYVNNKPAKRIVRCRDLLSSAAKNEGLSPDEYLKRLRQPGSQGGLYGGGPELTVLSNILRRPTEVFMAFTCIDCGYW